MKGGGLSDDELENMRQAYARDVAIVPPPEIHALVANAGFCPPIQFFQAAFIHACYARKL